MKKKVKIKNTIVEPAGTPAPKGSLQPFDSEESVSRDGSPNGGEKGNEERKREGLEEEKRDKTALKNHVEQERSLRGDVFSHSAWITGIWKITSIPTIQCQSQFLCNTITFEAERGKGKTGEIAVDGVMLVSG
ncbi:Epidermal growth factor-like protein 6 [Myotis davidii]|uniref:Epidermal growth factor-like protein 6 n=1 Tax=Myotis davidii TaxID=225400 RepID=L5M665_MYODS|nr:Epidermal growth factor-like protein 6 [Myotis davidii]